MPLALSDDDIDVLMTLASPLPLENRSGFLEAVAAELAAQGAEPGPGAIFRVAKNLQRRFLDPSPPSRPNKYFR